MNAAIGRFDIVITTAQVPGRRPPLLVSANALAAMQPGSVVVDLAASAVGRQRRGVEAGHHDRHRQRRHGHRCRQPALRRADSAPPPPTPATSCALLAHLVRDGDLRTRPGRRDHRRRARHPRRRRSSTRRRCRGRYSERDQAPDDSRCCSPTSRLRAQPARRVRGDQQGPGDPAHAADVRLERHPRRRRGRGHGARRHRRYRARLRPVRSSRRRSRR